MWQSMYLALEKQGKGGVHGTTELRHQDKSEGSQTSKTPSQGQSAPDGTRVCHAGVRVRPGNEGTSTSMDEPLPVKGLCGHLASAVQVRGHVSPQEFRGRGELTRKALAACHEGDSGLGTLFPFWAVDSHPD